MLHSLHLRQLELRYIDAKLSLFYKIHYGLLAIPTKEYSIPLSWMSRHATAIPQVRG